MKTKSSQLHTNSDTELVKAINQDFRSPLTEAEQKGVEKAMQEYFEQLGKVLIRVERSALSLERKLFFQAAILRGNYGERLMELLLGELREANLILEESIKDMQAELSTDQEQMKLLMQQYALESKHLREFKKELRVALIKKAETEIQRVLEEDRLSEIEKIRKSL